MSHQQSGKYVAGLYLFIFFNFLIMQVIFR